jgi:hypothetical protein
LEIQSKIPKSFKDQKPSSFFMNNAGYESLSRQRREVKEMYAASHRAEGVFLEPGPEVVIVAIHDASILLQSNPLLMSRKKAGGGVRHGKTPPGHRP